MITRSTKRMSVISVVLLLSSIAVTWWLYYYIETLQTSLHDKQQTIATAKAYATTLTKAQQAVAQATVDGEEVAQLALTESDTITFLTDLEEQGRQWGVEVVTDSISKESEAEIPHLSIRLTITGQPAVMIDVITYLEVLPYASWLENVTWTRTETGAVEARVVLNVVLNTL